MIGTGLGASGAVRPFYNRGNVAPPGIVRTPLGTATHGEPGVETLTIGPVNANVGDCIIVAQRCQDPGDGSGIPSGVDLNGQAFTTDDVMVVPGIVTGYNISTWHLIVAAPVVLGTITITQVINSDGNYPDSCAAFATKYTGVNPAGTFDQNASGPGLGVNADSSLTPLPTAQAHELLAGFVGTDELAPSAPVWQLGFSAGQAAGIAGVLSGSTIYEGFLEVFAIAQYRARLNGLAAPAHWGDIINTYRGF